MSGHFFLFCTVNYVVLGRNGRTIHQHVMTKSGRIFLFLQYQKVTTLKGLGDRAIGANNICLNNRTLYVTMSFP